MKLSRYNSQSGFSIVMAIISLAIIAGGTTYIININKQNKVQEAHARSTTFTELEKRRISAVLSNATTCRRTLNFGQQVPNVTKTSLVTGDQTVPAKVLVSSVPGSNQYFNKVLTLTSIRLSAPNPAITGKNYELILTYIPNAQQKIEFTGNMQTVIRIPMYVKIANGIVDDCYALTENSNIDQVITASCSPDTLANSNANNKSTLTYDNGVAASCKNDTIFEDAPNSKTTCADTILFKGFGLAGNTLTFPTTTFCSGLIAPANGSTSCSSGQSIYKVTASNVGCGYAGADLKDADAKSAMCSAGQILWRNAGGDTACVNVSCTGSSDFVQTVSASGTTCYSAPTTTCGPDQYVSKFNADGTYVCSDLPVLSTGANCDGVTYYGYAIVRATSTAGGELKCAAYTKTKNCPTPTSTTFAYRLSATSADCTTW